jgi:hypothetical protein
MKDDELKDDLTSDEPVASDDQQATDKSGKVTSSSDIKNDGGTSSTTSAG